MGHALVSTLQDVMIRWKRMCGFETLWVPGTDHAGIATQTVVERNLMTTMGKRRKDFSREKFLEHVWEWKAGVSPSYAFPEVTPAKQMNMAAWARQVQLMSGPSQKFCPHT